MTARIGSIGVIVVMMLVAFSPTVFAQDENKASSIRVDFQPQYTDTNSTEANLMDDTTIILEKDIVTSTLGGIEGKYYGPYLESSLFQFNHEGRYFQFCTNFTIGPEVIMNGASTFWVRVPIVPSQYEQWHVFCSWGYFDVLEGNWAQTSMGGPQLPWAQPSGAGPDAFAIWEYLLGYWGYSVGSGNVWKVNSSTGDTYQLLNRDTGLYIEYKGIFHSNEPFTICFTGLLLEDQYPKVFLSQEREDLTKNQTFYFYDIYNLRDDSTGILSQGFKYRAQEDLAVNAAWTFLFVNGIGKDGMLSYKLKFRNSTTDFIEFGNHPAVYSPLFSGDFYWPYWSRTPGYQNDSFLSFYMPFSAQRYGGGGATGQNSIDWNVHICLGLGQDYDPYDLGQMYFDRSPYGLSDITSLDFVINSTENYLLFSSPYRIIPDPSRPTLSPDAVRIHIRLTPIQQCDIIFLGADLGMTDADISEGMWGNYYHEDEAMVHPQGWYLNPGGSFERIRANRHLLPLYANVHWSTGQWAELNESKIYWVYNFGWGVGYHFPGSTRIYLFTDTGGQFFYNGSLAEFAENLSRADTPWYQDMWSKLVKYVQDIFGIIWDGLQGIWKTLKNIGEWIVNTVVSIIGWIISILKDIANKVSHIVEGMLYGVPMIILLFCANYAASYLNTGHMPKLSKERRFIRKQYRKLKSSGSEMVERSKIRAQYSTYVKTRRARRESEIAESIRSRSRERQLRYGSAVKLSGHSRPEAWRSGTSKGYHPKMNRRQRIE